LFDFVVSLVRTAILSCRLLQEIIVNANKVIVIVFFINVVSNWVTANEKGLAFVGELEFPQPITKAQ